MQCEDYHLCRYVQVIYGFLELRFYIPHNLTVLLWYKSVQNKIDTCAINLSACIICTIIDISETSSELSSKPTRFVPLSKLANQSTFNRAHVIKIKRTCTVTFMKTRNSLIVRCKAKRVNWKKQKTMKMFFKLLVTVSKKNIVVYGLPSIKWTS